jgi:hypothetical protein
VSIRLAIMAQEHSDRQISEWRPGFPISLVIDHWALQHDSRPASIKAVPATAQTRSQSSVLMSALRERQKSDKMAGFPVRQKPGGKPDAIAWAGMGAS